MIRAATAPSGVSAASLARFRIVGENGAMGVLRSFAAEDTQHPPLYYEAAYWWERATHAGARSLRLLSALLSLLLLPAIFWLAFELFDDWRIAFVIGAVAAVSPFNIAYAQEAREYALWAAAICASSAALLRALRRGGAASWWLYGLLLLIGMYAHIFFVLVLVSHAAYVIGMRRTISPASRRAFFSTLAVAFALSLPWLCVFAYGQVIYPYLHSQGHGLSNYHGQDVKGFLYAWATGLALAFTGLEWLNLKYGVFAVAALLVEALALVTLIRKAPPRQWWFVVCMAGSCLLLQIGNLGITNVPRYLTPALLAMQITVGWLFGRELFQAQRTVALRGAALLGLAALVAISAFDDALHATQSLWWTNDSGLPVPMPEIAQQIDRRAQAPLVIGWAPRDWQAIFELAPFLRPSDRVSFDVRRESVAAAILHGERVFVVSRWDDLAASLQRSFVVQPIAIPVPVRGYDLVASVLHSSEAGAGRVVWLWSVARNATPQKKAAAPKSALPQSSP